MRRFYVRESGLKKIIGDSSEQGHIILDAPASGPPQSSRGDRVVYSRRYNIVCKRAKRLAVSLHRTATGPLHLVLDSTGLKVFGEGEWKVRQHGYTKRRTWRKLHLSVDSETQEIQAVVLSEASLDDAGAVPELLDQSAVRWTRNFGQVGK